MTSLGQILSLFRRLTLLTALCLSGASAQLHAQSVARVISLNETPASQLPDKELRQTLAEEKIKAFPFPRGEAVLRDRLTAMLQSLVLPEDGPEDIYFIVTSEPTPSSSIGRLKSGRKVITLSSGFLKYFETDSELAMVLGHELEHLHSTLHEMGKTQPRYQRIKSLGAEIDNTRAAEMEVDVMSLVRRVIRKGHSPYAGFQVFDRMHRDFGMRGSTTHPLHLTRREVMGFSASLAIRAGGLEAADRMGTDGASPDSLVSQVRERVIDTPEVRAKQERLIEALISRPDTEVETAARQIRAEGHLKNFKFVTFWDEVKRNWSTIKSLSGPMDPRTEEIRYRRLQESLNTRYDEVFRKHFPDGYKVRSPEEFTAIESRLLWRYWTHPNGNPDSLVQTRRRLLEDINSAHSTANSIFEDEWKRRDAEFRLASLKEELTKVDERLNAVQSLSVLPTDEALQAAPIRSRFRKQNVHVLGLATYGRKSPENLEHLTFYFQHEELTPELRKKVLQAFEDRLAGLGSAPTAAGRVAQIHSLRDMVMPQLEVGEPIRKTLVSGMLERATPSEATRIKSLLRGTLDRLIAGAKHPSECVALIESFSPRSIEGPRGGTDQVKQAALMKEANLVLNTQERESLLGKAKGGLGAGIYGDYGFADIQESLSRLANQRGQSYSPPLATETEARELLRIYAGAYQKQLGRSLSTNEIPTVEELEALVLVKEGELFRKLACPKYGDRCHPLPSLLPTDELRSRLERLSTRRAFLTYAAATPFDVSRAALFTKKLLRHNAYNSLPKLTELGHFFHEVHDSEPFFRWANTVRDAVSWTGHGYLSSFSPGHFIADHLVHAPDPYLARNSSYALEFLEEANLAFRGDYFSGKLTLPAVRDRMLLLARESGDPAYEANFFRRLGTLTFDFDRAGSTPAEVAALTARVRPALAQIESELGEIARKEGKTLASFLDHKDFTKITLPERVLAELSKTEWVSKATPEVLAREVPALVRLCGPAIEIDQVFSATWKRLSSERPELLEVFKDPWLVRRLQEDHNRVHLAAFQTDRMLATTPTARDSRRISRVGGKETVRPVISDTATLLGAQFPDRAPIVNQVVEHVARATTATPAEMAVLDPLRFRIEDLKALPQLSRIDLIGTVERLTSSPQERYDLMEWLLGLRKDFPSLKKVRDAQGAYQHYTGNPKPPAEQMQKLEVARRSFQEGVHPLAQTFTLQVFLDHRTGILASPAARERTIDLILGKYGEIPILRQVFVGYVEALPIAEQRTLLSHLLIRKSRNGGTEVALREIFESMGPLGAKLAQFLRTLGVVPKQYRDEFDGFFDDFFRPERQRVMEYVRGGFGKDLGPITHVGEVKGSGSIAFVVEAKVRTPTAPQGKAVVFRFIKDEAPGQIRNESQVIDALVAGLRKRKDADASRVADYLSHIKDTVMVSLDANTGAELHLSQEIGSSKRAAAVYDSPADRATGYRVQANRIDAEALDLIPPHLRDKIMAYEAVEFTPWKDLPAALREQLAGRALRSELDALLVKGEFDPDGHPGNWLVDTQGKRLVRVDYSQITAFPDPASKERFQRLLRLLVSPKIEGESIAALSKEVSSVFEFSRPLPDASRELSRILRDPGLPPSELPHERLFFIQNELLKTSKERGLTDAVIRLRPEYQTAFGSLSRMSQFAREMAKPELFAELLVERMGLPLHQRLLLRASRLASSPSVRSCIEHFRSLGARP